MSKQELISKIDELYCQPNPKPGYQKLYELIMHFFFNIGTLVGIMLGIIE